MAYTIDVDTPKLVTVGSVSVLLLTSIMLATHAYFLKVEQEDFAAKYYNSVNPQLEALNKQHGANMHTYKLIAGSPGTVQIPVEDAMRIMVETRGKPPATQPLGPR